MVSFELQYINLVTNWWYQFLLDISKFKLFDDTNMPMILGILIMLLIGGTVFLIMRTTYEHYDIDCYPLLDLLFTVIGLIAVFMCAPVITDFMNPMSVIED